MTHILNIYLQLFAEKGQGGLKPCESDTAALKNFACRFYMYGRFSPHPSEGSEEFRKMIEWADATKESLAGFEVERVVADPLEVQDWGWIKSPGDARIRISGEKIDPDDFLIFYPSSAELELEVTEDGIIISRKSTESSAIPVLVVYKGKSVLDFFVDFLPFGISSNFPEAYPQGSWSYPIWDYKHPASFFTFLPLIKAWKNEPQLGFSYSPEFHKIGDFYLPTGNFFKIAGASWVISHGSGEIKFAENLYRFSLINYTEEPAVFYWIVPDKYRDKLYWIKDGRKLHKVSVPPERRFEKNALAFFIDPGLINHRFIPTLIVMQSESRVEWFPLPILRG